MKTRTELFRHLNAEFANMRWSWCAVHHEKREVYFGMWDTETASGRGRILSKDWERPRERLQAGYTDGLKKIGFVQNDGYTLKVFTMIRADGDRSNGPSKIDRVEEELITAELLAIGDDFYAVFDEPDDEIAEQLPASAQETFPEGGKRIVTINAYERSGIARRACILEHGLTCKACEFNFGEIYGTLGEGFIHVHHLNLVSAQGGEYHLYPIQDLIPLCPNCHAMVHRKNPPMAIDELRELIAANRAR